MIDWKQISIKLNWELIERKVSWKDLSIEEFQLIKNRPRDCGQTNVDFPWDENESPREKGRKQTNYDLFQWKTNFFWQTGPIYLRRITYSIWLIIDWILCWKKSNIQEWPGYNHARFLRPKILCLYSEKYKELVIESLSD